MSLLEKIFIKRHVFFSSVIFCSLSLPLFSLASASKDVPAVDASGIVNQFKRLERRVVHHQLKLDLMKYYFVSGKVEDDEFHRAEGERRNGNKGDDKSIDQFRVSNNVVAENCILGIASKVTKLAYIKGMKGGKRVPMLASDLSADVPGQSSSGPVDLSQPVTLSVMEYDPGKDFGYKLSFGPGKPQLFYVDQKNLEKDRHEILELNHLCQERAVLIDQLVELKKAGAVIDDKNVNFIVTSKELDLAAVEEAALFEPGNYMIFPRKGLGARPVYRSIDQEQDGTGGPLEALPLLGQQSLAYRYQTIKAATKNIRLETLEFGGDESGLAVGKLLIRKKQEGVDVKVFIDELAPYIDIREVKTNGRKNAYKMYNNFMAAGIPVYGYDCAKHGRQLRKEFKAGGGLVAFTRRKHEKIQVTDDQVAIVGGINVQNLYFRVDELGPEYWRDHDVAIRGGGLAQDVADVFDENVEDFINKFGDPRLSNCFNQYPVGSREYMQFLTEHSSPYLELVGGDFRPYRAQTVEDITERGLIDGKPFVPEFVPVEVARVSNNNPLKYHESKIETDYLDIINQARRYILITHGYFMPGSMPKVVKAIVAAAKRGVKVKILTNSMDTNDPRFMSYISRYRYKDLVDATYNTPNEVEIYEWTGMDPDKGKQVQGMLHAKTIVVDDKLNYIGSYNLDGASNFQNTEIGVNLMSKEIAGILVKQFYEDDMRYSRRVSYDEMLRYRKPRGYGPIRDIYTRASLGLNKMLEHRE
ncbi:MAG: phosphatidylserine/phosphatidylglycerophosphate/cardiolipin synthase family protein [Oligoflexia bacterium]|nr:phosphatidylserine/phosphatidylglycerophosphate/cardiolipin synthase family protein [Oligoflexia bacterium]